MNKVSIIGQRFGSLTVLYEVSKLPNRSSRRYMVQCDCGTVKPIQVTNLVRAKSCGCMTNQILRECRTIHGASVHGTENYRAYYIWRSIKARCDKKSHKSYPHYGGRGITYPEAWKNFESFISDVGWPPSRSHTIDRINNEMGYSKENCKWSTPTEQARNRRSNRLIESGGRTKTLIEWSEITGIPRDTLSNRLNSGWPVEIALTKPVKSLTRKVA